MKSLKVIGRTLGLLALLTVFIGAVLVFAEEQAIDMKDYEKLATEGYANADGTRKIVEKTINNLDKEIKASGATDLLQREVADAKYWFKRANDLLKECKKQIDAKKFSKDLVINLNQSWQWFIKAGSSAVRASMMP